jgi:hypothetical protein
MVGIGIVTEAAGDKLKIVQIVAQWEFMWLTRFGFDRPFGRLRRALNRR